MITPFDPQVMPGADERKIALETVASAIAAAKVLAVYAQVQDDAIEAKQRELQPVMQPEQQENSALSRQHYDLQDMRVSIARYLNDLNGWQIEERAGQPGMPALPPVPADIQRYVQSIKDGVPYVEPVHTG